MKIWKPTKTEADMIRRFARQESTEPLSVIEIGTKRNVDDRKIQPHMNVALVTRLGYRGDWADTDLDDFLPWSDFLAGVELTDAGEAIVDFYLYGPDAMGGNLTVYYSDGKIERIQGYGGGAAWFSR